MSHIETGNTKLSLPVLVEIARVLDIRTDDLLRDNPGDKELSYHEISSVLEGCSPKQLRVITEIVKAAKAAMEKYQ